MKIRRIYNLLLFLSAVFLFSSGPVLAGQEGRARYQKAVRMIKNKDYDFALMEFRSIIRSFPGGRYARQSLFAVGEYFYNQKSYYEAIRHFSECVRQHPDSDEAVFARAYLLHIARKIEEPREEEGDIVEDIEMELFSQPLFLLFSEYKEVAYKSAFQNNFTIRYYIDIIEVYKNDTLFVKITP